MGQNWLSPPTLCFPFPLWIQVPWLPGRVEPCSICSICRWFIHGFWAFFFNRSKILWTPCFANQWLQPALICQFTGCVRTVKGQAGTWKIRELPASRLSSNPGYCWHAREGQVLDTRTGWTSKGSLWNPCGPHCQRWGGKKPPLNPSVWGALLGEEWSRHLISSFIFRAIQPTSSGAPTYLGAWGTSLILVMFILLKKK